LRSASTKQRMPCFNRRLADKISLFPAIKLHATRQQTRLTTTERRKKAQIRTWEYLRTLKRRTAGRWQQRLLLAQASPSKNCLTEQSDGDLHLDGFPVSNLCHASLGNARANHDFFPVSPLAPRSIRLSSLSRCCILPAEACIWRLP